MTTSLPDNPSGNSSELETSNPAFTVQAYRNGRTRPHQLSIYTNFSVVQVNPESMLSAISRWFPELKVSWRPTPTPPFPETPGTVVRVLSSDPGNPTGWVYERSVLAGTGWHSTNGSTQIYATEDIVRQAEKHNGFEVLYTPMPEPF